jgi:hypothetical protein
MSQLIVKQQKHRLALSQLDGVTANGEPKRRSEEHQRSSGRNPVRLAAVTDIRGPIS